LPPAYKVLNRLNMWFLS